ncbi:MAG: T9SS type A sorting domain-containing protein [bacterium]|nr:T9SS type A sorting domain-containing protein [bacterium]
MRKVLMTIVASFLLVGMMMPSNAFGAYNGAINIDSVSAQAGESFQFGVWLSGNDISFSGMRVPMKFDNSLINIDSVSFSGSMKSVDFQAGADFSNFDGLLTITYLANFQDPLPVITGTSGLLATVYGHVDHGAAAGSNALIVTVNDSISVGSGVYRWERPEVTDNSGSSSEIITNIDDGAVSVDLSTSVEDKDERALPASFSLAQNYPNPFNPSTVIDFSIPKAGDVKLKVFNILGQSVRTLIDGPMSAGQHTVYFDASGLPSGIYFYRLTSLAGSSTRKMALIK